MRKFTLFASLFVWSFLFGKEDEPIDFNLLEKREIEGEKIYFLKDSKEPYSGRSLGIFENGEKQVELTWKDGECIRGC